MRKILLSLAVLINFTLPVAITLPAYASCPGADTSKGQVLQGIGESGSGQNDCNSGGVNTAIRNIVDLLSYFVGVISVVVIIIAGVKYITSGGDSNKITNAKSTLLYALIGLAIAALAQLLVHFVLFQANQATK